MGTQYLPNQNRETRLVKTFARMYNALGLILDRQYQVRTA